MIFEEGANSSVIAYLKAGIQKQQTEHAAAGFLLAKIRRRLLKEEVQPLWFKAKLHCHRNSPECAPAPSDELGPST